MQQKRYYCSTHNTQTLKKVYLFSIMFIYFYTYKPHTHTQTLKNKNIYIHIKISYIKKQSNGFAKKKKTSQICNNNQNNQFYLSAMLKVFIFFFLVYKRYSNSILHTDHIHYIITNQRDDDIKNFFCKVYGFFFYFSDKYIGVSWLFSKIGQIY